VTLKSYARKTVLSALRGAGVFTRASTSRRRQDQLLILCYHGISLRDEHEWSGDLYVTADHLRRRLEMLQSFDANVIPLGEGIDRLRAHSLPPRSVAITFDDGFYDFHRHALPLLRRFGYPCTVYLTTHYTDHRFPVFNLAVNYMLWKSGLAEVELPEMHLPTLMSLRNRRDRVSVVRAILEKTAKWTTLKRNRAALELARRLGIDYDELVRGRLLQIMSPEEISEAASSDVQIELHTHRHRTPRDRQLFQGEILDNRARILEMTGHEPTHFCYPSGDCAPEFLPWLKELGVKSATTCRRGLAESSSQVLMLPRILDNANASALDFESWLCGLRV
jgi:peptidoglycan/xylan/chitin deacetylase (PgdA/CDA1 family)